GPSERAADVQAAPRWIWCFLRRVAVKEGAIRAIGLGSARHRGESRRGPKASTRETGGTQRIARGGRLVVGALRLADDDRAFVPLACEKHRVVGLGAPDRLGDGLASVVDAEGVASGLLPGRDRAPLRLRE